ncbi:MAG: DNA topoisomerase I [Candidatus Moraniibacteriota bacterium]|nr:MAG: DNA topoisomerase I [Candidatus Moranbacteria bacterium]
MKLLIVESPTKTKTIKKYLGTGYSVTSSVGHIRDLPKSNKDAIDIENDFKPRYENSPDKKDVIDELVKKAKKADEIYLATDPDREGEAIAWHIAEILKDNGIPKSELQRIVFHEITKEAVNEAMKHPKRIDQNLRRAQEARRVLDRLVGYDLSGVIWKKVRYGLSAGRVQSPALRILVEREKEIHAFEPETYWNLSADFKTKSKDAVTLTCKEEPRDKKEVTRIQKEAEKGTWIVTDVKESTQKRRPRAPFTTSTLQQTASSRLGFSPSRTMRTAQKLYEAGHITYMRTDSTTLSQTALKQIKKTITEEYGRDKHELRVFKTKSKNAQEAHEAVRPSDATVKEAGANPDQKKLYKLIRARTIASQMIDAQVKKTKITANVEKKSIPDFTVTGSRILSLGWLAADTGARGEDTEVPKVEKDENLTLKKLHTEEKETLPPPRYSEAGLVKELEKRGIGRPSTYASIIRTIQNRGYVEKEGRSLKPTDTGEVVSDFLSEHFEKYISDTFTAEMEDELDDIARGEREYTKTLADFYKPFAKDVKTKDKLAKATNLGNADKKFTCPKCKSRMIIKLGKNGKFMSCKKFPDCDGARTIDGKKLEGPKETGEECPKCKDGKLVEREGRYGKFISCANYPKCKYIKEDPKEAAKKNTGVKCPMCEKGTMTERNGRFGVFYSCTEYPECKNAIKAKPTGKICNYKREDKGNTKCGALMMEGTKTIPDRCSDKTCPNHRPDKLEK